MSVVVVVRKRGKAAIASDSLSSLGSLGISSDMKISPKKIQKIGRSYLGLTGNIAHHRVVTSLIKNHKEHLDFTSADSIFESLRTLQPILRDEYYVYTDEEDDTDQEYESNQLSGLICGPSGIFSVESYREVSEYEKYWAIGTGMEIALGSLYATYDSRASARSLAERAVRAACFFHRGCGLPVESFEIALS